MLGQNLRAVVVVRPRLRDQLQWLVLQPSLDSIQILPKNYYQGSFQPNPPEAHRLALPLARDLLAVDVVLVEERVQELLARTHRR